MSQLSQSHQGDGVVDTNNKSTATCSTSRYTLVSFVSSIASELGYMIWGQRHLWTIYVLMPAELIHVSLQNSYVWWLISTCRDNDTSEANVLNTMCRE